MDTAASSHASRTMSPGDPMGTFGSSPNMSSMNSEMRSRGGLQAVPERGVMASATATGMNPFSTVASALFGTSKSDAPSTATVTSSAMSSRPQTAFFGSQRGSPLASSNAARTHKGLSSSAHAHAEYVESCSRDHPLHSSGSSNPMFTRVGAEQHSFGPPPTIARQSDYQPQPRFPFCLCC